ncbi:hypothetical protein CHS0354_000930 [Potamilus streckersoni]|uniref:Uncharacterized protein n=1 Tax=Potamilus streckersoni TaxID=2493646 RepID=A0AAE0W011_9BIVA|nr:hypothetical protein CHS0354_000930 [Potamilus streckersoni]
MNDVPRKQDEPEQARPGKLDRELMTNQTPILCLPEIKEKLRPDTVSPGNEREDNTRYCVSRQSKGYQDTIMCLSAIKEKPKPENVTPGN